MNAHPAPAARQRLDIALRQWRHWQCSTALDAAPALQGALGGGISNHSFLVASEQRQFVVRVDGVQPARHGLSRSAEWQILHAAHRAGIAPEPCYCNPELGVLVCAFLPADTQQAIAPRELAALLQRIHTLPARHYRLDLAERIARYEGLLKRAGLAELAAGHRSGIAHCLEATGVDRALRLCHNDLIPANLLRSGGALYALDWEYSAMGSRWFDVAGAALGQGLAPGEDEELLGHYLEALPKREQRATLQCQRVLCRYIEFLWYLLESAPDQVDRVTARHLPALEMELAELG